MAIHRKLKKSYQEAVADVAQLALSTARSLQTATNGTISVSNGDGTTTVIGVGAGTDETGSSNGTAYFVGDTTPPSAPTGVTFTALDGSITGIWDGTLTDGVPADFDRVVFRADGSQFGTVNTAGSASSDAFEVGSTYSCDAVAVDVQGNVSDPCDAVEVTVRDLAAEADELAEEAKALAEEAQELVEEVKAVAEAAQEAADAAQADATAAAAAASELASAITDAQGTMSELSATVSTLGSEIDALVADIEANYVSGAYLEENYYTKTETDTEISTALTTELYDSDGNAVYATTSELSQTSDEILATVAANYVDTDTAASYATTSYVDQTASSITSSVAATYATQASLADYVTDDELADELAGYVTDSALSTTLESYSTVEQTADAITSAVTEALYTTDEDGNSTAIYATTSSVTQTADEILSTVAATYVTADDAASTYATQTSLSQTATSLTASITAAAETADEALGLATTVEASLEGFEVTVSETYATQADLDAAEEAAEDAQADATEALEKYATLSVTVDGVSATASSAYTTANTALTNAATAQATADAITTKVTEEYTTTADLEDILGDYATTDAVSATLSNYSTTTETAEMIASEVSSALYTTDSSGNTTAIYATTSEVTQTAEDITSTVSETYATIDYVDEGDDVTIGGTNLLPGTGDWSSGVVSYGEVLDDETYAGCSVLYYSRTTTSGDVDIGSWKSVVEDTLADSTYTLSFWAKSDDATTVRSFFYPTSIASGVSSTGATTVSNDGNISTTLTDEWTRYWVTWTTTSSPSDPASVIACRIPSGSSGSVYVAGVKLETGDVATDWSPAPEDAETYTDSAVSTATTTITTAYTSAIKQSADEILSTVAASYVDTETGATYATKSYVDQQDDAIELAVASTYATQSALAEVEDTADAANETAESAYSAATALYGTCATAASTAAKVVTCSDFALFSGASIAVTFTYANTAGAITLNVNSTGAKSVYVSGGTASTSNYILWSAGTTVEFVYDGTYWFYAGGATSYKVTCGTAAATAAKTATQAGAVICKGTNAVVTWTYGNSYEGAITLNLGSTAAKSVYYGSAVTSSSNLLEINATETFELVFSGAYWYVADSASLTRNATLAVTVDEIDASVSEVYETTGYTLAEIADLAITAESITSTVSETYATIDYVDEGDDVEIGGRNLLPDTRDMSTWGSASTYVTETDDEGYGICSFPAAETTSWRVIASRGYGDSSSTIPYSLVRGKTCTLSFEVRAPDGASVSSVSPFVVYTVTASTDSTSSGKYKTLCGVAGYGLDELTEDWQRAVYTFTASDSFFSATNTSITMGDDCGFYISPRCSPDETNTLEYRKLKLETGDVATDWSPAPEDAETYTDSAVSTATTTITTAYTSAIKQSAKEILTEVAASYVTSGDLSTTLSEYSTTSQTADAITSAVSSALYDSDGDAIYATTSEVEQTAESITTTFTASGGSNLLADPGFESTDYGATLPSGFAYSTTSPHSGDYCMACTGSSGTRYYFNHTYGDATDPVAITVEPDETYTYSMWYKASSSSAAWASDNMKLRIATADGNDTLIASHSTGSIGTDWTQITGTWTNSAGYTEVYVMVVTLVTSGTVYVDDAFFGTYTASGTLIRESSDGVEVAKYSGSSYSTTRTLMAADGFHVQDSSGTDLTVVDSGGMTVYADGSTAAEFTSDEIVLGANMTNSVVIKTATGGAAYIGADVGSDYAGMLVYGGSTAEHAEVAALDSSSGAEASVSAQVGSDGTATAYFGVVTENGKATISAADEGEGAGLYLNIDSDSIDVFGTVVFNDAVDFEGTATVNDTLTLGDDIKLFGAIRDSGSGNVFSPQNDSGNTTIGYARYANADGNMNVYGDEVHLCSNEGVYLDTPNSSNKRLRYIDCGTVTVGGTANAVCSEDVTFNVTFESTPTVVATALSTAPGTVTEVTVGGRSTTGCTVYQYRTSSATNSVMWIAVGYLS